ncbi:hypothetical protein COR50_10305 [Chitinophaga caeni]|uniref:Uncharacterized protein n=1 Tax=Chitinophaga caeni TaxID=2029983 RepID=A0A291QUC1_9BACT|nr:hypothetical protein COR50_10305 [Chitinophaga caeni]
MIFANADLHPDASNVYTSDLAKLGTAVQNGQVNFATYALIYLGACNASTEYKSKNFPGGAFICNGVGKGYGCLCIWSGRFSHESCFHRGI